MLNKMNKILDFVRENKEFESYIFIEEIKTEIKRIELVLSFNAYKLEITYCERKKRSYTDGSYTDDRYILLKITECIDGKCLYELILDDIDFETIKEYLLLEQKTDKARRELLNKK